MEDENRFRAAADALVGRAFSASLATNSLKFEFDPRNHRHEYIWIDPPWFLYCGDELVMSSTEYSESTFESWAEQLTPIREARLLAWSVRSDLITTFNLDRAYRLVLRAKEPANPDSLFTHWFAAPSAEPGRVAS